MDVLSRGSPIAKRSSSVRARNCVKIRAFTSRSALTYLRVDVMATLSVSADGNNDCFNDSLLKERSSAEPRTDRNRASSSGGVGLPRARRTAAAPKAE